MAQYDIRHRWDGTVLFRTESSSCKRAVEAIVESEADLCEANLRGADLREANLGGADLGGADLYRANLRGSNLRGADLHRADLYRADLRGADLREANLYGTDLRGADLREANLYGTDLYGADLSEADLRGVSLREADLTVPIVAEIDKQILAALDAGGTLAMAAWHQCQTTHCRAGWAIHLAGEGGAVLEARVGPCAAGALIYHASAGYVPNFYASDAEAYADIRAHAGGEESCHGDLL